METKLLHEAGHAAANLHVGRKVVWVFVDHDGAGACESIGPRNPRDDLFTAACGYMALRHFGYDYAMPSRVDRELMNEAIRQLGICDSEVSRMLAHFQYSVGLLRDEIGVLFRALRPSRHLNATGIARLCLSSPVMRQYRDLYADEIARLPAIDAQLRKNLSPAPSKPVRSTLSRQYVKAGCALLG